MFLAMGSNSLAWNVKTGDLEAVRKGITKENVNSDLDGRKAIHFAADYGQNEVLEYLFSIGADPNAVDSHGITALLAAVWEEHEDTVRLLIAKGAKKEGKAPDGKSYAESTTNSDIRDLLEA